MEKSGIEERHNYLKYVEMMLAVAEDRDDDFSDLFQEMGMELFLATSFSFSVWAVGAMAGIVESTPAELMRQFCNVAIKSISQEGGGQADPAVIAFLSRNKWMVEQMEKQTGNRIAHLIPPTDVSAN